MAASHPESLPCQYQINFIGSTQWAREVAQSKTLALNLQDLSSILRTSTKEKETKEQGMIRKLALSPTNRASKYAGKEQDTAALLTDIPHLPLQHIAESS